VTISTCGCLLSLLAHMPMLMHPKLSMTCRTPTKPIPVGHRQSYWRQRSLTAGGVARQNRKGTLSLLYSNGVPTDLDMQKIITEKIGEKTIILLQEDVDAADHRLIRRLQSPRQSQNYHLWIDCSSLKCIKTHGFCHFINQLLLLKSERVSITLLHLSKQQQHLLNVLQVASFFTVVPDLEEAYQLVQAS
jgi:anti-anti-sigma regulatory factor